MKAVVLGTLAILAATAGFAARKFFAKKPAVSGKIFSAAPKAKESDSIVPRREDIAQIDILKILKFQSEILFEECTKYDSTLYLSFPPQLPRIYGSEILNLSSAVFDVCEFFLQNITEPICVSVEFSTKELKKNMSRIKLDVRVGINRQLKDPQTYAIKSALESVSNADDEYLRSAQAHLATLGTHPVLGSDGRGTFIKMDAMVGCFAQKQDFSAKKYDYNVIITHKNRAIFEELRDFLNGLGCDVMPNSNWESAKRHLNDFIYVADVVILDAEILRANISEINYLNALEKDGVFFIFLLKNKHSLKVLEGLNFKFFKLEMPYFYDEFYATLDIIEKIKNDENFLGL
ncbi:hypothetical protein [uncultured Campylobacter sp.]|uniref:hypothetical protein n=1 Tax=uncultured Campylobacter sp. TaxID=218934 RepID=UPI00262C76DD|nr:hypothetical protein [uncultured Campylobacter sp.]